MNTNREIIKFECKFLKTRNQSRKKYYLAGHEALLAGVEHVVLHHEAGDLGAAGVGARHGVLLARVEVRLQLVQRARPRAALVLIGMINEHCYNLSGSHLKCIRTLIPIMGQDPFS